MFDLVALLFFHTMMVAPCLVALRWNANQSARGSCQLMSTPSSSDSQKE